MACDHGRLTQSAFHRWIIVNARDENLAWSGEHGWIPHYGGFPGSLTDQPIPNFDSEAVAIAYAKHVGIPLVKSR